MRTKHGLAAFAAIALAACVSAPAQPGERMPGGTATLACAERLLRTLDYEVRRDARGQWVEGELRGMLSATSAERHLIRVLRAPRVAAADPEEVEVQVLAFHYLPAMAPTPVRAQDVVEVSPSPELVDDAATLRVECRGPGPAAASATRSSRRP
jgi:glutamine amidotransferase PdxT